MRWSDIVERAGEYLLLGGIGAALITALTVAGYFLVYRRLLKGQKKLRGTTLLWIAVSGCYALVLLSATLLDRGGMFGGRVIPLFYSYREAWRDFSAVQWRNLGLNILLFVPFGFLLPLGLKGFRRFWRTYLAGFLTSLCIELVQLVTRRGVSELDDIFNNLLGTMIGYGLFAILRAVACRGEKKKPGQTLLLQLPLAGAAAAFGILAGVYYSQELGNLYIECILPYDREFLDITSEQEYEGETGELMVYRADRLTAEEAEARAEAFFQGMGTELDRSRVNLYDNVAVYYSTGQQSLWLRYAGGTYSFTDFGEGEAAAGEDATEQEIRQSLESYGVFVPAGAAFENRGEGYYAFYMKQYREGDKLYDGEISCSYARNGRMKSIQNNLLECGTYKLFPALSQAEAFEKLCRGEFSGYLYGDREPVTGEAGEAVLSYQLDSKDFYQPVYVFDCVLNGEKAEIEIPALREKNGGSLPAETAEAAGQQEEFVTVQTSRVTVHDPSVIEADGVFYIFGSHMAWAKSTDLMNWEYFTNNINEKYEELFGKEWENWCQWRENELKGNLWAPDVIYNESLGKYCLYMSVNGSDWNSAIVMLTSDKVDGDYEYGGTVVYSGFDSGKNHPAEQTDVYRVLGEGADLGRYQSTSDTKLNCIDPCVTYDSEGNLWMAYGSWFGGIYLLKLDGETGLRDYDTVYATVINESDAYYGYKIAGGCGVSGEGPYIIYRDGYYYLFVSYGGLTAAGGYQIRVFRSENITGPYEDQLGNSAVYIRAQNNLYSNVGIRLMGSYSWTGSREIPVAQGHNSACAAEDGRLFLVYHSRFAGGKYGIQEAHEVRVRQLFVNREGWLVAAPYEYGGEHISDTGYSLQEMCGDYELLVHTPTEYYRKYGQEYKGILEPVSVTLCPDGRVEGDRTGSWSFQEGTADMSITLDGVTYSGVFLKMPSEQLFEDETARKVVMTFTALGENVTVWGSK